MSIYAQMIHQPSNFFRILKDEINIDCKCYPFANKAIDALKKLDIRTENQGTKAAVKFLSDWQTLAHGGIIPEDFDKIDFTPRKGKEPAVQITVRVEAFIRAAARKGYTIIPRVIAVPKGDDVYFEENLCGSDIVYVVKDKRVNTDREITAVRLIDGYFSKFLCRIEISNKQTNKRVSVVKEMSNDQMLKAQDKSGKKILSGAGYNPESFWVQWTAQMVEKTIIRYTLRHVREALPELKDTIQAFSFEDEPKSQVQPLPENITIPIETVDVNLDNLTVSQQEEVKEMFELFKANPKLAEDKANEAMSMFFEQGKPAQAVINTHYAALANIRKSSKTGHIIRALFEAEVTA